MSYTAVMQRVRVAARPTVTVPDSEEEEEEDNRPTLPMEVELDGGYDEDSLSSSSSDEEEEEEEGEDEDEKRSLLLRVPRTQVRRVGRKSVAGKRPRKSLPQPVSKKAPRAAQKQQKKKKKRPRDPYDVAKEAYDNEGKRIEAINSKYRREIAKRSQPQYKAGTIKPSGSIAGKIAAIFRDRPDKDSIVATDEDLKRVLRVEEEKLVVFDIVLRKGQLTKDTDTLKRLHFTGYVVGEDPDPYPMGGHMQDEEHNPREANNPYDAARQTFDKQVGIRLKVGDLAFRLEVNGHDWQAEGAIEEIFYFLINKKAKDPHSMRKRPRRSQQPDPLRVAFDADIAREKADDSSESTWRAKYNYNRDVAIMHLGNYLMFLHTQLDQQMAPRETPIPLDILLGWLAPLQWNHIY